jgi:tetratricopeptide (TPR) repeat protein
MDTNAALALLEVDCGRLDEGLALAKTVPPEHNQYDAMRGAMAWTHSLKGDFAQAIEAIVYEPSGIVKFYRSEDLDRLSQSQEGSKLVELQGRRLAGIFPPARWIRLAGIYMAQEALEKADGALDEAKKLLGSNPVLQISYWRARARNFAAQGKSAEADDCVARARAMIKQFSPRSTVMETHLAIGRSYLSLRRCGEALTELAEAQRFSLHPVEKHQVAYWIGRTHEAAGNPSEAIAYYQKVASDNIPSWMRSQAAASVTKLTAKIPPLPSSGPPATD